MVEKTVSANTISQRDIYNGLRHYFSGRTDVVAAIVFGSVARGDARPHSDLDVGVLLTRDAAQLSFDRSQLITDIMGLLRRHDVDVVILNKASPLLLHRVLRDGHVVVTTDSTAFAKFTIRAIQQYEDTRPLRELQSAYLKKRLATVSVKEGQSQ